MEGNYLSVKVKHGTQSHFHHFFLACKTTA